MSSPLWFDSKIKNLGVGISIKEKTRMHSKHFIIIYLYVVDLLYLKFEYIVKLCSFYNGFIFNHIERCTFYQPKRHISRYFNTYNSSKENKYNFLLEALIKLLK